MDNEFLIKGAKIIDGTGKDILEDVCMVVEEGKIKYIGKEKEFGDAKEIEVLDMTGKTIMPGMINSHVHILMEPIGDPFGLMTGESEAKTVIRGINNLKKHLKSGVTYFRDMGGYHFLDIELKNAIEEGFVEGPNFLASGKVITMTGGHGWQMGREVNGADDVRKGTREQLKAGADVIKIMATGGVMTKGVEPGSPQLTFEEIKVAVEEAHKAGKKTASHAQGTQGIKNAVLAGIDSIEHGIFLNDEIIELMLKKGTYLVPTLVAPHFIIENGVEAGIPVHAVEKSKRVMSSHFESFRKAKEAGVKIAMGTDAGTPFNLHDKSAWELKLMAEAAMTNMEAIVSATKTASELLGVDKTHGTLETGKVADFIVLNENPIENIDTLLDISEVYKNGVLVKS
ncbi:metal-dependent hydrolase family protein [Clostridiisalibacter paucivorans]|uniref:metal-dependent hydrolase family protein n=1 Tax=Clostridiisalibacter paucivorans TaxID=408753 RepID=UPI0005541EF4|nr:amidohydrolase family protein [Clostridiisalibacter paucivorans]